MDILSNTFLKTLNQSAMKNARQRQNFNLHQSYSDQCQVLINSIASDSYIRPHRHSLDKKQEYIFWISGDLAVFIFTDEGQIKSQTRLGSGEFAARGVKVEYWEWHTVVSLEDNSAILEVKSGPFEPSSAKEFALWAPAEVTKKSRNYLDNLKQLAVSDKD